MSIVLLLGIAAIAAEGDSPRRIVVPSVLVSEIERVAVPALEAGQIASFAVREGQRLEKGALIAQIDDREAKLDEERARAELEKAHRKAESELKIDAAQKELDLRALELKRAYEAVEKSGALISQSDLDKLRLEKEKAELDLEQAREDHETDRSDWMARHSEWQIAKRSLERRKITAPFTGELIRVQREAGEWVKPGDPVAHLVRTERLRAEGYVDADLLPADMEIVGLPVVLELERGDGRIEEQAGELKYVSQVVEPATAQVRVWAEIDNSQGRVRPGERARLVILMEGE